MLLALFVIVPRSHMNLGSKRGDCKALKGYAAKLKDCVMVHIGLCDINCQLLPLDSWLMFELLRKTNLNQIATV